MYLSNALWMVPVNEKTLNLALQRQIVSEYKQNDKDFSALQKEGKGGIF